jgi:hypothetical protein
VDRPPVEGFARRHCSWCETTVHLVDDLVGRNGRGGRPTVRGRPENHTFCHGGDGTIRWTAPRRSCCLSFYESRWGRAPWSHAWMVNSNELPPRFGGNRVSSELLVGGVVDQTTKRMRMNDDIASPIQPTAGQRQMTRRRNWYRNTAGDVMCNWHWTRGPQQQGSKAGAGAPPSGRKRGSRLLPSTPLDPPLL